MDTTMYPADPDLSDVRAMVLRWLEAGRGDALTYASALQVGD